jgi:RNA polymerase sigma-70 factor (ECF subfamily)
MTDGRASELVATACAAWPDLCPPAPSFATIVDARLARGVAIVDPGEILLAHAAANGHRVALRELERRLAGVDAELARMGLRSVDVDEVKQYARTKLLAPDEDGRTKLVEYAGEGRLSACIRVVALRAAVDLLRRRGPQDRRESVDDRTVDALVDTGGGPELEAVYRQHRDAVRAAVADAIGELAPRDRAVLRMHLLERLSIDGIAELRGVHRGTAARWLVRLRDTIGARTRALLAERLALDANEVASLCRAIDSQLDLSLPRLLDGGTSPSRRP